MNDGIDPPFIAMYAEAMLWHTESAVKSIEFVAAWIEKLSDRSPPTSDITDNAVLDEIQNILHQAGCVSRYFFPARQKRHHLARANKLRQVYNLPADSPLKERHLRDAIEHFDERLDDYLKEPKVGQYVMSHIGFEFCESEVPLHLFKGYYLKTGSFVLLGFSYPMAPIVAAIQDLHEALLARR